MIVIREFPCEKEGGTSGRETVVLARIEMLQLTRKMLEQLGGGEWSRELDHHWEVVGRPSSGKAFWCFSEASKD